MHKVFVVNNHCEMATLQKKMTMADSQIGAGELTVTHAVLLFRGWSYWLKKASGCHTTAQMFVHSTHGAEASIVMAVGAPAGLSRPPPPSEAPPPPRGSLSGVAASGCRLGAANAAGASPPQRPSMIESGAGGRCKLSSPATAPSFEMTQRVLGVKLLPGEKVKGEVGARRYDSQGASTRGILLCTNFRVAFVPAGVGDPQQVLDSGTAPLGLDEVALSCIERLVAVSSSRSKVLTASSNLKFQPEEIRLHCRDFRLLHFQLEPGHHTRQIVTLIAQSSRPESLRDLFLFDYALEVTANTAPRRCNADFEKDFSRTRLFESHLDWESELDRTGVRGWRVSLVNERFEVSASLSRVLVVPRTILDLDIKSLSALFTDGRIPRWTWHHAGSNLLRMSSFQSTSFTQRDGLSKLEEMVCGGHTQLVIADLGEDLPSPADIQQAYSRLRSLCACELPGAIRDGDEKWLSSLESTRWLEYVRLCLKKATDVSALLGTRG
ncbi:myotubularin-related protein 11-like [Hemitrygon akajei]|uniref:myotubularin-related protein 11-like n=1 Tax=Hemitrygon akajei TaxID=2704970 RepID=UPI003BFA2583